MEYSDKIKYQVVYINSLLKEYNEESIFDNKNFIVDEISWSEYLKITYKKAHYISFDIIFSSNEFQINIDRTNEVLDISSNCFTEKKQIVKDFIDFLFTCRARVEYCGSNYTKIFFYNDKLVL